MSSRESRNERAMMSSVSLTLAEAPQPSGASASRPSSNDRNNPRMRTLSKGSIVGVWLAASSRGERPPDIHVDAVAVEAHGAIGQRGVDSTGVLAAGGGEGLTAGRRAGS